MREWTHKELHALIDRDRILKAKSDEEHAMSRVSFEEKEQGKLRMMEIYADAVYCKQIGVAKEFIRKVYEHLWQGETWYRLREEYASQRLCHSPEGNDYVCFCYEKK